MMKEKPRVSVICITYGHEDYIAQALDSFLMQKTDFPFQILVGEDKGPDRTAEIVLSYAEKYPDKIIPFIREENMGAQRNLIDLCSRAGTEYLAFCEGDDYWTDEYKLQKQFDLMEEHPEYRACVHATEIDYEHGWSLQNEYKADKDGRIILPYSKGSFSEEDVVDGHIKMDRYLNSTPFHTSSYFYRWNYDLKIPEWYYKHFAGDHSMMMMQVGDGLCGVLPDVMSVYRRSEVGVYYHESFLEHYYDVGLAWGMLLMDLRDYFEETYGPEFCREVFDNKISNIAITFFMCASKLDKLGEVFSSEDTDGLLAGKKELFSIYCDAAKKYKDIYQKMERKYSEQGIRHLLSKDNSIKEFVEKELEIKRNKKRQRIEEKIELFLAEDKERDPFTWVFVGDNKSSFSGNVRHLYEYVIAFHPEIQPVWITNKKKSVKFFEAENMPVVVAETAACKEVLGKASLAFINQYKTGTLDIIGFNKNIGIVRLGGSSLIDFSKEKTVINNPQKAPKISKELVKAALTEDFEGIDITENNIRFFVEDYANTFLQVANNQKSADLYEEVFGIEKDRIMLCGSPRSFAVNDRPVKNERMILIAPGKRGKKAEKKELYSDFISNIDAINEFLVCNDYYATIYLDESYTYDNFLMLGNRMQEYSRINVVAYWGDIYHSFNCYDVIVSDWSDIMYDFILQDKPAIIYTPASENVDYPEMLFDYEKVIPGKRANSWDEVFKMITERIEDPSIDREIRTAARDIVFDMSVNDENNSERIITAVKRRLNIQ